MPARWSAWQPFCGCIIHDFLKGQDVVPAYGGAAPGMVTGIAQINFQATETSTSYYYLGVDGKNSDPFFILVTP